VHQFQRDRLAPRGRTGSCARRCVKNPHVIGKQVWPRRCQRARTDGEQVASEWAAHLRCPARDEVGKKPETLLVRWGCHALCGVQASGAGLASKYQQGKLATLEDDRGVGGPAARLPLPEPSCTGRPGRGRASEVVRCHTKDPERRCGPTRNRARKTPGMVEQGDTVREGITHHGKGTAPYRRSLCRGSGGGGACQIGAKPRHERQ